jgi:exodeoxyribonuclease-3
MTIKIVSYNINGFRSSVEKGLLDWIEDHQFDIVCLQETKTSESKVPQMLINAAGYQHVWHHAKRGGYSGVATLSLNKPSRVHRGTGIEKYDVEGRVLRTDFAGFTLLNCYFPNGGSGEERQKFKMQFLNDFYSLTENLLEQGTSLIVVGDYNIAHSEMDINSPGRHQRTSGFLPEEREWMTSWLELGMVDSFRMRYPKSVEYTWWRFNVGAKEQNKGWRLDYQSVSDDLVDKIVDVKHMQEMDFSDHCPVVLELDL